MTEEIKKYIETASYGELVKLYLLIEKRLKEIDNPLSDKNRNVGNYGPDKP